MAQALMRRRSEAALQASEERWQLLVENPLFGITFLDQHGRFITTNPTYQRMTGYTNEELRGLTPLDISVASERELNEFLLKELQEGKRQHYEIVKQLVRKDGGLIWIQLYVFAIQDPKTKTLLIFGVTFDITESKLAQDALSGNTGGACARVANEPFRRADGVDHPRDQPAIGRHGIERECRIAVAEKTESKSAGSGVEPRSNREIRPSAQ